MLRLLCTADTGSDWPAQQSCVEASKNNTRVYKVQGTPNFFPTFKIWAQSSSTIRNYKKNRPKHPKIEVKP